MYLKNGPRPAATVNSTRPQYSTFVRIFNGLASAHTTHPWAGPIAVGVLSVGGVYLAAKFLAKRSRRRK